MMGTIAIPCLCTASWTTYPGILRCLSLRAQPYRAGVGALQDRGTAALRLQDQDHAQEHSFELRADGFGSDRETYPEIDVYHTVYADKRKYTGKAAEEHYVLNC